jgi:hypothetical protein
MPVSILFLLGSCMQFQYCFVSPGRVPPDSLHAHNIAYSQVSKEASSIPNDQYEVIGHGAGSWRYYPMNINRKGNVYGNGFRHKKDKALGIIELIDSSIAIDPTMSIEIDAQYAPDSHLIRKLYPEDGAYVLHDTPKWKRCHTRKKSAINYLHDNTIRKAMDHFVASGYYRHCKMYVEIKVSKQAHDPIRSGQLYARSLAKELEEYIRKYSNGNKDNWLCINSFSPLALEAFRNSLPCELQDRVDYVLIAGYTGNWLKGRVAQKKGYVPEFTPGISAFVTQTPWLDCVWFSAQGIKDFNEKFNTMIAHRKAAHPEWKEVEFSYATYPYKFSKMKRRMSKTPKLNAPIRSFMLDLDYTVNKK